MLFVESSRMNRMDATTAYRNIVAFSIAAGAACGVPRDAPYFQLLERFSKARSRGSGRSPP